MNNATLFLTREQHDELLKEKHTLCGMLFVKSTTQQWSLAGVRFEGLPQSLVDKVVDFFKV